LPIPESLWAAAAELARKHGINPTAKALHLEYGKLKQRAEAAMSAVKKRVAKAPADVPRRAALLRGFSSSGINRYVNVIMQRTAEEGKLRLPLCCAANNQWGSTGTRPDHHSKRRTRVGRQLATFGG